MTTADYEHGCHFTGLPTPVICGYNPDTVKGKFYVGSQAAWVFPNHQATVKYLEFTGQGLKSLENNLTRKEGYMAILGARMLELSSGGNVESATTAAIHRGGEQSVLASMAQAISIGMEKVLLIFSSFAGGSSDPSSVNFELNRDFFPVPMDALTLTALVAAWQNQAISYETMYNNLVAGDIIDSDGLPEDEQKAISDNPPPQPPGTVATTPGNQNSGHNSRGDGSPANPKMQNSPSTLAPTITQLQHQ